MPNVFCYLLGAGASANALPVSADLPQRMRLFIDRYRTFRENVASQKPRSPKTPVKALEVEEHFLDSLAWLASEAKNHSSVDTLAKKLHLLRDRRTLNRLKVTLSTYLLLEQAASEKDFRYDSFFATTLTTKDNWIVLPDAIRVVTWNYDLQLEKAYLPYSNDFTVIYQNVTSRVERLNGLVGSTPSGHFTPYMYSALGNFDIDSICTILDMYSLFATNPDHYVDDIQFAWEQDPQIFHRNISPIVQPTTVLIVVGYSFPYFNRDIDKILVGSMPNLQRVHIQVRSEHAQSVKTRFQTLASQDIEINVIEDQYLFHIPFDL